MNRGGTIYMNIIMKDLKKNALTHYTKEGKNKNYMSLYINLLQFTTIQ